MGLNKPLAFDLDQAAWLNKRSFSLALDDR